MPTPRLSVRAIRKEFGRVKALDGVDLEFAAGEIHAVLGENGAGKSTLMHILGGVYPPDSGEIDLDGERLCLASPREAGLAGIGMVHQHFALVEGLTVAENLALSFTEGGVVRLDRKKVAQRAAELAGHIGLDLPDAEATIGSLPVGSRQRLEILKALASAQRVLILDEPTAVLTPQEVQQLFGMLRRLRAQGLLVIFITHKLAEVADVADRVSLLRQGRSVGTYDVATLSLPALAEKMIGSVPPPQLRNARPSFPSVALRVEGVSNRDERGVVTLDRVGFEVRKGEIFGIAGVDGNGQRELFDVLCGLSRAEEGRIEIHGVERREPGPQAALAAGIGAIPPDRHREGLVLEMTVDENLMLHRTTLARLSRHGFLDRKAAAEHARNCIHTYRIKCSGPDARARELSGGNQQKVILARELAERPGVLVTANPTRGLDLGACHAVAEALRDVAAGGCAIVLISTDLDEVIDLSDRIAVLYRGRLSDALPSPADPERIGRWMAGLGDSGGAA